MRVLVTGAKGYVGSAVARALVAKGHQVVALVRPDDAADRELKAGYEIARGELTDASGLRALVASVDAVFHGAASQDPAFAKINAGAVDTILGALRETSAFAMQAGSGVFGDTSNRVFDGTEVPDPPPPLAAQSALEQRVLARSTTGPRCYVVYGPLVYGGAGAMIPNALVGAARQAGAGQMIGAGNNRWSTVFIDDWAELIALLLERGPRGGGAFVASSGERSLHEIANAVADAIGTPGKTVSLSMTDAATAWGFFAPLLSANQRFSGRRAELAVGWKPMGPTLEEELRLLAKTSSPISLPTRRGPRPAATSSTPHEQLDQNAPLALQNSLWESLRQLPNVTEHLSRIAPEGSRALSIGDAWEFVHLHPNYDGSLHLTLPEAIEREVINEGWGEQHPLKRNGRMPSAPTMVYGPRDEEELNVVMQIVGAAHTYASRAVTGGKR